MYALSWAMYDVNNYPRNWLYQGINPNMNSWNEQIWSDIHLSPQENKYHSRRQKVNLTNYLISFVMNTYIVHQNNCWNIWTALKTMIHFLYHYFNAYAILGYTGQGHKNIKRHTAHTIVSSPNPKQWIIDHTSDLMMIIRQSNIFSQPSRGNWVKWKHTAPYIE